MLHRGWNIELNFINEWQATGPNYDASYEGPEDGWVSNGETVTGNTLDEVKAEIDAYIEEQEDAERESVKLTLEGNLQCVS